MESEERLENIIESRVDILGLGDLLVVGRQVVTEFGKRIDLLAIDGQGDLYVIELKKDKTPRDVVAQALEYGYWIQNLSFEAISDLFSTHHDGRDFESAFTEHFESDVPDAVNTTHHLVIVAAAMDTSTEQIVDYVRGYGVPINVLFFQFMIDDNREYLARSWRSNPDLDLVTVATGKKQPPWNGRDFFVAVGEEEFRNWDDMRRYGFVSAGQGEKYRKAMLNLQPGARVWAEIPSRGYVGVGEVVETALPVTEFDVEVDGSPTPILQAPVRAANIGANAYDPTMCEYFVRVRWLDTRPREDAFWEKGMFANQNVVAKLRHPFTLQRLADTFDV
ncbi:hypothetical protein A5789_09355 [Nocardia sp. 852002-51101_SCH5132738]|nr:hypothetical protein A5789_09355 [Nocardia sp. 852002-51101_SCH5132738]OBB39030.1 hypothetical protein A5748_00065 [Nocardia sp. 852002-51244_SCH5132740]OBF80021.1 hypothetical protein A9X06_21260 [Mycobacterium sp. 852002-51759_SCH5129042]